MGNSQEENIFGYAYMLYVVRQLKSRRDLESSGWCDLKLGFSSLLYSLYYISFTCQPVFEIYIYENNLNVLVSIMEWLRFCWFSG